MNKLIKKIVDKSKTTHKFSEFAFDIETSRMIDEENKIIYEDHFVPISCSISSINNEIVWYHDEVQPMLKVFDDMFETIYNNSTDLKKGVITVWVHNLSYEFEFITKIWLKFHQDEYFTTPYSFDQKKYNKIIKKDKEMKKSDGSYYGLFNATKENNTVYQFTITYKGKVIMFKDSMKFMSQSLDSITNSFVDAMPEKFPFLKKKKNTKYEYLKQRKLGEKYNQEEIDYTINDVLAVNAIIYLMKNQCGDLGLTLAGTSYQMMKESCHKGIITEKNSKLFLLLLNKFGYIDSQSILTKNIKNLYKVNKNNNIFTIKFKDYTDDYSGDIVIEKENEKVDYFYSVEGIKEICKKIRSIFTKDEISELENKIKNNTFIQNFEEDLEISHIEKLFDLYQGEVVLIDKDENKRIWKEINKTEKWLTEKQCNFELDQQIRPSYRGGITQLNPIYQYRKVDNVMSFDVNSSYPYVLSKKVPYKLNKHLLKDQEFDKDNQAKLMKIKVSYRIKYGYPALFANKSFNNSSCNFRYQDENAIEYVWNDELEIFKKLAYITNLEILESWVFDMSADLYSNYVNKYYKFKSTMKSVSPLIYIASKLLLNSPYGKLAENLFREKSTLSIVNFDENNELKVEHIVNEDCNPEKIDGRPIFTAAYITAMGRTKLLQGCYEVIQSGGEWLYMDTDSVYFSCKDFKVGKSDHNPVINNKLCSSIKVDSTILGEWDVEVGNIKAEDDEYIYYSQEKAGKYLNPKRYQIYTFDNKVKTKCAGFTKESQKEMTQENFVFGSVFNSRQKVKTPYGVDIVDKEKQLMYPEFLYYCKNIERNRYETISSKFIIEEGTDIIDVYGERNKVISVLFNPNTINKANK